MTKKTGLVLGIALAFGVGAAQAQDSGGRVKELEERIAKLEARLSAVTSSATSAERAPAQASPSVGFNGDANIELDTTQQPDTIGSSQTGRVELNVLGKTTFGDAFVAGKASFLARKDGSTAVDDMWVQAGNAFADLKLGRFEAADLFPLGRDTIISRAGSGGYRANFMRGRFGGSSGNVIHAAGNVNFGGGLGLELGLAETRDAGNLSPGQAEGVRPVLTYTANGVALKLGFELGRTTDGGVSGDARFVQARGVGFTAGAALGPGIANLNLAAGKVDGLWKAASIAANYTVPLGPWVHVEYGRVDPEASGLKTETVRTIAMGYQFPLLGIKNATVTPAFSYSKASSSNAFAGLGGSGQETERAFRLRFNYTFAAF